LIPANQYTDVRKFCLEYFISKITGSKIKLFIISRIIRNMHLTVFAKVGSIRI